MADRYLIRHSASFLAVTLLLAAPPLAAQTGRLSVGVHAGVYAAEGLRDGWFLGAQATVPMIRGIEVAGSYSAWVLDPRDFATAAVTLRSTLRGSPSGSRFYAGIGAIYDNSTPDRIHGIFDTAVVGAEFPGGAVRPFAEARISRIIWGGAGTVHLAAGMSIGPR